MRLIEPSCLPEPANKGITVVDLEMKRREVIERHAGVANVPIMDVRLHF